MQQTSPHARWTRDTDDCWRSAADSSSNSIKPRSITESVLSSVRTVVSLTLLVSFVSEGYGIFTHFDDQSSQVLHFFPFKSVPNTRPQVEWRIRVDYRVRRGLKGPRDARSQIELYTYHHAHGLSKLATTVESSQNHTTTEWAY